MPTATSPGSPVDNDGNITAMEVEVEVGGPDGGREVGAEGPSEVNDPCALLAALREVCAQGQPGRARGAMADSTGQRPFGRDHNRLHGP